MPTNPLIPLNRTALANAAGAFLPQWNENAELLKLDAAQRQLVGELRAELVADNLQQRRDRATSKASTAKADRTAAKLRAALSSSIAVIRATAASSADPGAVLAAGEVPAAATPTPKPAPPAPQNLKVTLQEDGSVRVNWDASIAGTTFTVQRQLVDLGGNAGRWLPLGFDGVKPCIDATVPAGVLSAVYQVRATRGSKVSPWSTPASIRYTAEGGSDLNTLQLAA